jgi:hypothetical protein
VDARGRTEKWAADRNCDDGTAWEGGWAARVGLGCIGRSQAGRQVIGSSGFPTESQYRLTFYRVGH